MKKAKKKAAAKKSPAKRSASKGTVKIINKAGMTPLGDRVLVKPISPEEAGVTTSFGIIIPDTAKEKPEQGRVVAVGMGKRADDGKLIPMSVKVGDKVMFSKYGYDEVKVEGVEYFIVREESILAILN
jgi:chaperonin GroES